MILGTTPCVGPTTPPRLTYEAPRGISRLGPGGQYIKHLQDTTGARVNLVGQNSGSSGQTAEEAVEPMSLKILAADAKQLATAKSTAENLLATIKVGAGWVQGSAGWVHGVWSHARRRAQGTGG